jgi:hypothetical protein
MPILALTVSGSRGGQVVQFSNGNGVLESDGPINIDLSTDDALNPFGDTIPVRVVSSQGPLNLSSSVHVNWLEDFSTTLTLTPSPVTSGSAFAMVFVNEGNADMKTAAVTIVPPTQGIKAFTVASTNGIGQFQGNPPTTINLFSRSPSSSPATFTCLVRLNLPAPPPRPLTPVRPQQGVSQPAPLPRSPPQGGTRLFLASDTTRLTVTSPIVIPAGATDFSVTVTVAGAALRAGGGATKPGTISASLNADLSNAKVIGVIFPM